jgi:site-specific DNA-methyltransferase (adenine-specific)
MKLHYRSLFIKRQFFKNLKYIFLSSENIVVTIELNKIHHEDCLDFMRRLEKEQHPPTLVDVIVTSPPYNINKEYGYYLDNKEGKEYLNWLYQIAQKSFSILKENGSFFLNIAGTPSDQFLPFDVANKFEEAGYHLQNTIHWIKSISFEEDDIGKSNGTIRNNYNHNSSSFAVGHFKPIVSERFLTDCHEYIFHFTKTAEVKLDKLAIGVPYQDKTNIGRWKSAKQDRRDRGNTWFIPYPTINESRPHPAVFPEKLPYLCIKLHGIRDDLLVYDPFMGIGTTALACLTLNVNYIGTEIDEEYIKIASENILQRKNNTIEKKNEDKKVRKIIDWVSTTATTEDSEVLGER